MIFIGDKMAKSSIKRGLTEVEKIYSGDKVAYTNKIYKAREAGAKLLLLADLATGFGSPTNSPLTNPWVDLSDYGNNATPTNFAGTAASGVDISDPVKPFWVLDGTDDFFSLVNTPSLDITTAPLAMFATFKATSVNGFLLCKNNSYATNIQYAILLDNTTKAMQALLEKTTTGARAQSENNSILTNIWYNAGWIWNGENVQCYVNFEPSGIAGAFNGTLTSRAYTRIGCRELSAVFFKGNIATVSIYAGINATAAKVLAAETLISAPYLAA
jgi:hypothetical protein